MVRMLHGAAQPLLFLAAVLALGAPAASYSALGCHQATSGTASTTDAANMTEGACESFCQAQPFTFPWFALTNGDTCLCRLSAGTPGGTCNAPCAGDAAQTCGGSNASSLFQVDSLLGGVRVTMDGCTTVSPFHVDQCNGTDTGVYAAVKCCLDGGFCDSDLAGGGCYPLGTLNFFEAKYACESDGRRLCTAQEMTDNCCSTGCNYDAKRVWTSEDCGTPSPTSSPPCDVDTEALLATFAGVGNLPSWWLPPGACVTPVCDWVPANWCSGSVLTKILLVSEQLTGTVDLAALPSGLQQVWLGGNSLAGSLDTALLPPTLTLLSLYGSQLNGTVDLTALPVALEHLHLGQNEFTGTVDLTALPATLTFISLFRNAFSGTLDLTALPPNVGQMRLNENLFTGSVSLATLPSSLFQLYMAGNDLDASDWVDFSALPNSTEVTLDVDAMCAAQIYCTAPFFPAARSAASCTGATACGDTCQCVTTAPTTQPTQAPTQTMCEGTSFDWQAIQTDASLTSGWVDVPLFDVDPSTVTLQVDIDVEYVGTGSNTLLSSSLVDLGSTWVLSFSSLNEFDDPIADVKKCENRNASLFENPATPYEDYWQFSAMPYQDVPSANYLAYPPTGDSGWTVGMRDAGSSCTPVRYSGSWTFNELLACEDRNGSRAVTLADSPTAEFITLSGTVYAHLVGSYNPRTSTTPAGIYNVREFVSQDFEIRIRKMLEVVDSEGLRLYTTSILAVSIEDDDTASSGHRFSLVLVTTSPYFLRLKNAQLAVYPGSDALDGAGRTPEGLIFTAVGTQLHDQLGDCLFENPQYTCTQLWQIYADVDGATCDNSADEIDFTGNYSLSWDNECNDGDQALQDQCATYQSEYGTATSLAQWLAFADDDCDPQIFTINFDAAMTFYTDESFGTQAVPPYQFQIQEPVYGQIVVNDPTDTTYSVFQVALTSLWLCTAPATLAITNTQFNQSALPEGCFDQSVDDGRLYPVILSGATINYDGTELPCTPQGCTRFSFLAPAMPRTTMQVHALLTLSLTSAANPRRLREVHTRVLLQGGGGGSNNVLGNFVGEVEVAPATDIPQPPPGGEGVGKSGGSEEADAATIAGAVVGSLVAVGLAVMVFVMWQQRKGCFSHNAAVELEAEHVANGETSV